jgi:cell division protein ZapA
MEKNRISIRIAGQELRLAGDESEQYMRELASDVNVRVDQIQRQYPTLSTGNAVLLVCLNMADELNKLRSDYEELDSRIAQLRDMPRSTAPAAPVKRPFEARQKTPTV